MRGADSWSPQAVQDRACRVLVRWSASGHLARMLRNPLRTRAGVSRPGSAGRSQGRRRSSARGRARRSWVWTVMISLVHQPAASGLRIFGAIQPRTCLNRRKVCSRSNLHRNACQSRSTSVVVAPVPDHQSQTGLGSPPPGRWSTCSRITVPSMMGSSPWCSSQAASVRHHPAGARRGRGPLRLRREERRGGQDHAHDSRARGIPRGRRGAEHGLVKLVTARRASP
ncbi:MAG: hypothetical protein JWL58_1635 [Streptosporangiaceae bacterium]|nr:hypothetical protein [Streptosporangiaceae bacterium]